MTENFVLPGNSLGISEEGAPGNGAFEEDGTIYASVVGAQQVDSQRRLSVKAVKELRALRQGDEVYAVIHDIYDQIALVEITTAPADCRIAVGNTYAFIRISEIQRGFVDRFRDYLRIGDVLKARIKDVTPLGTYITIMDQGLGVVQGFCTKCRTQLNKTGTYFTCPNCGNKENRKLA